MTSERRMVNILRAARAKIEQGWCQAAFAIDVLGYEVPTHSGDACAWCVVGAMDSALAPWEDGQSHRDLDEILVTLARTVGAKNILDWNDAPGRTREEVLALFDKAIAAEEEKENE